MRFSAGKTPVSDPDNDFLDVLTQQRQVLEELTDLAIEVRESLVSYDTDALEALAHRQEILTRQLVALDDSRQKLMEQWFPAAWEPPLLLSEKAQAQNGGETERLLTAYENVRDQVKAWQTANAVNHQLLAGMTRWMDGLLNGFTSLLEQAAPYDRHGSRPVQLESNLLMDRQA